MIVRPGSLDDSDAIWAILEPVIRAGETYTLPCEFSREETLAYWFAEGHAVFVAEDRAVIGTYFLQANQRGGGAHVANCGYVTAHHASGRGVASAMCEHSLRCAKERGFMAMQFNFVVSTNERAVALWQRFALRLLGGCRRRFDIRDWVWWMPW